MKKNTKNPKSRMLKSAKGILILVFICIGLNINAQSAGSYSANFIYEVNNQTVTFIKTSQASQSLAGMLYSWSFGDGASDTSGYWTTHTYAQNGNYYVCLTISTSSDSIIASFCDTVKVAAANAASCHAQFSNVSSQGGSTYFFNTSSGNVINSQWDFGDGTILYDSLAGIYNTGGGDVSHTYTQSGTYNVCLTVSNDGDTSSYCSTVTAFVPCNANFTAIDSALELNLYDLSSASANSVYYWNFGDGDTSNVHGSTVHNYAQTGTYSVCLTVSDSITSCTHSYCDTVLIGNNPVGPVVCNASFSVMQDSTDLYNYTVYSYSSNGSNYSYFWDFGDGSSSTLQYPNHVYSGNGPYYLCSTVSDTINICTDTHCDTLYAGRSSGVISLAVVAGVTGIVEQNSEILSIDLFPNPASENIIINYGKTLKNSTLEIYDVTGQLIKKENVDQVSTHSINISEFPNGFYILKVSDGKKSGVKRFVKQ